MDQGIETYYIAMGSGQILRDREASEWNFKIEATQDEIRILREYFDQGNAAAWETFLRAHVPFVEYHNDESNDSYDNSLIEAYRMVYELGDQDAKAHIRSMGILETGK
ncbi:hydrolase [Peribacillus sp. SCS-37]|uniref:hydrolase n=1 Tax=Paraperibacillus esterisolvens TaxID=3115296 RepID=UPI003905FDF0